VIQRAIISNRYLNDGKPLLVLTEEQKKEWAIFQSKLKNGDFKLIPIAECFFCHSSDGYLVAEKDRYGNPISTLVCSECGIIRSLDQLDEASTALFYQQHYRRAYGDSLSKETLVKRMELAQTLTEGWKTIFEYLRLDP